MSNKRLTNIILSVAAAIVLYGALALLFDFYYDLNDDVMIKDILSGVYTGIPDAHNNQMLYPLSALIAELYRIDPNIPWFGLFEIICMTLSFFLITFRILLTIGRYDEKRRGNAVTSDSESSEEKVCTWQIVLTKIICALFLIILFAGLMMWELVNIQYTVVAGVLTVTAAVMLYTGDPVGVSDEEKDSKGDNRATVFELKTFVRMNIPAIILVFIAFNIRSELVLLLSPLLAATAIAKWSEEKRMKDAFVICGYLGVFLSICLLMICSLSIDAAAYSSPEWKEYRRFFDARTELYDFTGVPDYEENKSFYDEAGISKKQVKLLTDYNYYEDDSIDADMLLTIADGVKNGKATGRSTYGKTVREAAWEYVHNMLYWDISDIRHPGNSEQEHIFSDEVTQHQVFNVITVILYVCLICFSYLKRDKSAFLKIPAFFVLRTVPWLYVYLQGRVLSRITHPLYLTEIMVLICILVKLMAEKGAGEGTYDKATAVSGFICILSISAMCICVIPGRMEYLRMSGQERDAVNRQADKLYRYTTDNDDTYFYIDTYSTVDLTEKIFDDKYVSKKNTQLLGGWMGNSPLDTYKRSLYDCKEIISGDKYLALTEDNK